MAFNHKRADFFGFQVLDFVFKHYLASTEDYSLFLKGWRLQQREF